MRKVLFILFILLFSPATALAADKIDINTASLTQLDLLVGIGPAIGQRIIDGRPYASLDDLLKVKGIGDKTLQEIKGQGLAYVTNENPNAQLPIPNEIQKSEITNLKSVDPGGVFINRLLPSPEGTDETGEWIEIKNTNATDIDISGWKLQDAAGTTTTYVFPAGTVIKASSVLSFTRKDTKITLNNDTDAVALLLPDNAQIDSVAYEKATTGKTYGPAAAKAMAGKPGAPQTSLSKTQKTDNKVSVANADSPAKAVAPNPFLADASESGANPWIVFFIAAGLCLVFAAVAGIIQKFKIRN